MAGVSSTTPPVLRQAFAFLVARGLLLLAVSIALVFTAHAWSRGIELGAPADAFPRNSLTSAWVRWDAYEWIAAAAGSPSPLRTALPIAGPAYPRLVRALGAVVSMPFAALVVSNLAAFGAVLAIAALSRRESNDAAALRTVWMLLLLPTSYLLSVPNGTALFVLAGSLAFLGRARSSWALGAGAVFLGACAHPAGVVLLTVPFLLEAGVKRAGLRRWPWFTLAAIPGALLGTLAFSTWHARALLNPLFRIGPHVEFGAEAVPGVVAWFAALMASAILFRERRYAEACYTAGCLLLPWLSLASTGRAAALAFPAAIVLARNERVAERLLVLFAPLLLMATLLHAAGLSSD